MKRNSIHSGMSPEIRKCTCMPRLMSYLINIVPFDTMSPPLITLSHMPDDAECLSLWVLMINDKKTVQNYE